MAEVIDFKFGSLIRTGPKFKNGGKWDAELVEWNRNASTNADLTIHIAVYFQKIDPIGADTGLYPDSDSGEVDKKTGKIAPLRKIVAWKPGEFEQFTHRLLQGAQHFWSGIFHLQTPDSYRGLDWPDANPSHRCNLYCKLELTRSHAAHRAHYTIAVVRVPDSETFRSNSRLYSQKDIQSEEMISGSTAKFFTHYHEVGHLLGLGHVGWHRHRNLHHNNDPKAYGVTDRDKLDVMGRGTSVHKWHATPWREAAAAFTDTDSNAWNVSIKSRMPPKRL
jgi:hypothetical protein